MRKLYCVVLCMAGMLFIFTIRGFAVEYDSANPAAVKQDNHGEDLIDINTATMEQLMTLDGITPEYARKIISGRPFQAKVQLRARGILPPIIYFGIHDKIRASIAGQK